MNSYSVALCTYNGEKYIIEQLDSIVNQTVPPTQIVVSDDGSSDGTVGLVNQYLANKNISYVVNINKTEHGVTSNFQNAFRFCTSEIIFTSDQDDYWMPNKAETMLNVYESAPSALVVFSNGELVDSDMNLLGCDMWKAVGITPERCKEGNWFHYLLKNCLVTGAAMSFRRSLLDYIDTIPKEWLHDGWLTWAAVIRNGLYPCPEKLIKYRQHSKNVVGMKPDTDLWGHFKAWLKNFGEIYEHRRIRYNRYLSLSNKWRDSFLPQQQNELDECISFWKQLIELEDQQKVKGIYVVTKLYTKGLYHKYYVGTRGFLRDIILILKH